MASKMLEARTVAAVDPGGMRDIIASLPEQLSTGMKVGEAAPVPLEEAQRIFVVGMGGSAIGGDVFAAWLADRAKIPIQVVRDYRLPAYARPEDLLVAVSYSGNTEETLAATAQEIKLGCRVVAITSGGTLRSRARAHRAILLRDRDEAPDIRRQLDITVGLMARKTKVEQVTDEGPTLVSRMLGTLFLGDYVSLYLAALRRVDPLVLKPIQALKAKLAESHRRS